MKEGSGVKDIKAKKRVKRNKNEKRCKLAQRFANLKRKRKTVENGVKEEDGVK